MAEGAVVTQASLRGGAAPADRSTAWAAGWAAALLFLTNLVGYLDRSILTLLVAPVKVSLRLTDGEMGLMLGAGFILTFSLAGLFIGRLADRVDRRNLLIICVAIWSLSAAACGLARNGVELFVGRMGVGVGEAAVYPIAVSVISDYFAPNRRGRPYGLFTMGVYAGGGLSLILTGAVLPWATATSHHLAARGSPVEAWRLVMFLMLIPGAVCCGLLTRLRDPRRDREPQPGARSTSGLGDWWRRRRLFLPHHIFMSLTTLAMVATTSWLPTALIREHAVSTRSAGFLFGTTLAITGMISSIVGGVLADRAGRRAGAAGALALALACVAMGCAGFVIMAVAPSTPALIAGFVVAFSPLSMSLIAGIVAMAELSPARSRGQITSVYFLFTGILGTAGGPALVGFLNDLAGGASSGALGRVLTTTGVLSSLAAVAMAWVTLRRARRADGLEDEPHAIIPAAAPGA